MKDIDSFSPVDDMADNNSEMTGNAMTKVKLCGLTRPCDIEAANECMPEYIGFVFSEKSRRYVTPKEASELKALLNPGIQAVGVFTDERPEVVSALLNCNTIDLAQLHGCEDDSFIEKLRTLTNKPIIQAFRVKNAFDIRRASESPADYILLDSGAGSGEVFDWDILKDIRRPYFLAGGLTKERVTEAIRTLSPYAVDVSSGIETDGRKDKDKMAAFTAAVRKEGQI